MNLCQRYTVAGHDFRIEKILDNEWSLEWFIAAMDFQTADEADLDTRQQLIALVGIGCAAQRARGPVRPNFVRKWTELASSLPTEELRKIAELQATAEGAILSMKELLAGVEKDRG